MVFDRSSLTFNEGQIGTWKRYFKPEHHKALNKFLGQIMEELGYPTYPPDFTPVATQPVLAITAPGAGLFLLDIVLDELGLACQFFLTPYPLSTPAEEAEAVPLDLMTLYPSSYAAAEKFLSDVKPNGYTIGYMPFTANGLKLANQLGLKKIVMVRDRRDTAVGLTRLLANRTYPVSAYLQKLPDEATRLSAVIAGVRTPDTNNGAFLLSNQEMFQHLANWSSQPDTLTVTYEDLVGEIGGGSTANQVAAVTAMCVHFGIDVTPDAVAEIVRRVNQRTNSQVIDGAIGQWKDHFNDDKLVVTEV